MASTSEALLIELAQTPPYATEQAFAHYAAWWEESASVATSASDATGVQGLTGTAASHALQTFAQTSTVRKDLARKIPTILQDADATLEEARQALAQLPNADPPGPLLIAARQVGLEPALRAAFTARREWAARMAIIRASFRFASHTAQLAPVAQGFQTEPTDQPATTADGQFTIGSPQQPTYDWDEDFAYNSKAAGPGDFVAAGKWKTLMNGARLLRPDLSDATDIYDHYWSNTGDPWQFDYEKAYADDSGVRANVDAQIAQAQRAATELASTGRSSFSFTGKPSQAGEYPATEDWQKTIGGYQQWSSGDVKIVDGVATMTVTVHADDHYNFNRGQHDIGSGEPDDANGRFTEIGWAKPFDSSGSVTRTVTWPVSDPSAVTVSPPPPVKKGR